MKSQAFRPRSPRRACDSARSGVPSRTGIRAGTGEEERHSRDTRRGNGVLPARRHAGRDRPAHQGGPQPCAVRDGAVHCRRRSEDAPPRAGRAARPAKTDVLPIRAWKSPVDAQLDGCRHEAADCPRALSARRIFLPPPGTGALVAALKTNRPCLASRPHKFVMASCTMRASKFSMPKRRGTKRRQDSKCHCWWQL